MRRARSPFTVYARKDSPIWWTHFLVGGRRRRFSTGETDRGRADERAAALWQEAKARAGDPVPAGTVRRALSSLAADLVAEAETSGRAASYARDLEVDLRLHILSRWHAPEEITTISWEQAKVDIHTEGQSWASVKRIGKHLRLLVRFCVRKGALVNEPVLKSPPKELIAAERAAREAMPRDNRDALLADMRERRNLRAARCYAVMFFNLFRKSTVERLMPGWIDWKARTIKVPPGSAKNRKARTYWMHAKAAKAIREQMDENEAEHGKVDLTKPIFGTFDHRNVFWGACRRLGLVDVDEHGNITDKRGLTAHHVARATAATMLVDAGVTTKDRMAAGGWETVEAAERYDHGEEIERSKRALRKLR